MIRMTLESSVIQVIHRNVDLECFFFNFTKMFVCYYCYTFIFHSYFARYCRYTFMVWWVI